MLGYSGTRFKAALAFLRGLHTGASHEAPDEQTRILKPRGPQFNHDTGRQQQDPRLLELRFPDRDRAGSKGDVAASSFASLKAKKTPWRFEAVSNGCESMPWI